MQYSLIRLGFKKKDSGATQLDFEHYFHSLYLFGYDEVSERRYFNFTSSSVGASRLRQASRRMGRNQERSL